MNNIIDSIRVEGVDYKQATHHRIDLSPVLMALGMNTGLKDVSLYEFGLMDESLLIAMQNGLARTLSSSDQ